MLDWAGGRAFDAGVTWLRMDAWTTNTRLHAYYLHRAGLPVCAYRGQPGVRGGCGVSLAWLGVAVAEV